MIADELARTDPRGAAERLAALVELSDSVYGRVDDGSGAIAAVFHAAIDDLGRLWEAIAVRDPKALARWAFEVFERNDYGIKDGLIAALGGALGAEGQAELQRRLEAALAALPKRRREDRRADLKRRRLTFGLEQLADLRRDVDGFIAASTGEEMYGAKRLEVAARLIEAGRAEEALTWLATCEGGYDDEAGLNLRIAALDRLGRTEEAQAARWAWFEATLSPAHLREYLKRLADFEDFEAERKAVAVTAAHPSAERALAFLTELPGRTSRPRTCWCARAWMGWTDAPTRCSRRRPSVWRPSTRSRPACSTGGWRRASWRGAAASSTATPRATCVTRRVWPAGWPMRAGSRATDAFVARLKREHGRKYSFWELLEGE